MKRHTNDIYNDVANNWTGYKAELREMMRIKCGEVSNSIVALTSDFESDIDTLKKDLKDEEKYSKDVNDVVQYWKEQVNRLGLKVKSLKTKVMAQGVLVVDLRKKSPQAVAPT